MSKIKELINDKSSVLVFDIDGVLAIMEFSEYNHFMDDEEWDKYKDQDINVYTSEKVSNKMKKFISKRDLSRIYVVTKVNSDKEKKHKIMFAHKYYNIPIENIYFVNRGVEKKKCLLKIKNKYSDLDDRQIVMIDDSVENLNDIMENTNYSTAHISSFLDI